MIKRMAILPSVIRCTTWNVSMLQLSASSPVNFSKYDHMKCVFESVTQTFNTTVHPHSTASPPDFIALQELPDDCSIISTALSERQYLLLTMTTTSHCGNVGLAILKKHENWVVETSGCVGPAVIHKFVFSLSNDDCNKNSHSDSISSSSFANLFIASMHLSPFASNASQRQSELSNIMQWIRRHNSPLISSSQNSSQLLHHSTSYIMLLGDMNMRDKEHENIQKMLNSFEFHMDDAWIMNGRKESCRYSWDSFKNEYHPPGSFQFKCRFDRIFFGQFIDKINQNDGNNNNNANSKNNKRKFDTVSSTLVAKSSIVPSITISSFSLGANTKPTLNSTAKHFLSDHYSLQSVFLFSNVIE